MKKVCLVFESLNDSNGVARAAIAMAQLLAETNEFQVDIIPFFKCDYSDKYLLHKNVRIKKRFGFYVKGITRFLDLFPKKVLYKIMIRDKYDVEIGYQFGIYSKIIALSTNHRAKHVLWMHGYDYGLKLRDYYPLVDKVVCVSKYNANRLKNELAAIEKYANIECAYNVIDDEIVVEKGAEQVDLQKNGLRLVSVGRFSPEKGYSRLVECIAKLRADGYTNFSLFLVGDGAEMERCKQISSENGLDNYVEFLGSHSNPHKYTSKCDLFICPSFSEGYSNACTEAIMLGVPVLTTNVPGGQEIIDDSNAGMVVENSDKGIYEGLKCVLDNREVVSKWKNNVSQNRYLFSKKYRSNHLINILKSL